MESTSNANIMSFSGERPRRKRTLDDKACEVCNDKSTGKHYGVYCCDGCSGFFKRTVRRSIPWLCRNNNQCVVDRTSRTDCRACRFKKCLMVNMNPEGVQNLSRVSYERTNRETDSSELNFSDLGPVETAVENVDSRDNSSSANPLFPRSSRSPPISMALADGNGVDLQHRQESPVLIKVETEQCEMYIEVDKNSSENVSHSSENVGSSSAITGNTTAILSNDSRIVNENSGVVSKGLENVGRTLANRNISQVGKEATKDSMVTVSQPVTLALPPQQPQVIPTQMLVAPTTSFTRHYPFQSTHYPLTSPASRYATTNHENRSTVSGEMSLIPKADSIQNMAEQRLSNSVQFAKNIPSFKSLPFRDQIILLEESWKDFFILDAAFWSFPLDISCIVPPGDANTSVVADLRVLQELITRIQALEVDETECGHLKTVVLFKPDIKGLKDSQQIQKHQDEALIKLSDCIRTTRVKSAARFGRLLLTLSAFERISQEMIEKLFFRAQSNSIEYILHDVFKKT